MDLLPGFEFEKDAFENVAGEQPVVPKVSDQVWQRLCAAALLVRELEPWKQLRDSQLVGIRHPESGEVMLLSVLGHDQNVFAVHLHTGVEGQRFWRNTLEAGIADESLIPYGLRMLECEWQNKGQCEAEDIEIWQRHGTASRKKRWWPQFRSWLPGYSPWFMDKHEAGLLTIGMELLHRLFDEARQAGGSLIAQFAPPSLTGMPEWIPLFELKGNGRPDRCADWQLTRTELPEPGPAAPLVEPEDELFAARLAKLPVVDDVWEIDSAWQDSVVFEAGEDRPFYAKAAVCVGQRIQTNPMPELYGGKTSDVKALRKVFEALAQAEGYLPAELRLDSEAAEVALRSVAASSRMKIVVSPLETVPQLLQMLSEYAGGDSPLHDLLDLLPTEMTPQSIVQALSTMVDGDGGGLIDSDAAALLQAMNAVGTTFSQSDDRDRTDDEDFQLPVPTGEQRYTLRISLRYSQPEIWRRISIAADAMFYHLHDAIQSVMPWDDSHLYEFSIGTARNAPRVGVGAHCEYPVATTRLIDVLGARKKKFSYVYDFGDGWMHDIEVEKKTRESTPDPQTHVADGQGIAPPDDCGGLGGFYALLAGESEWSEEWGEEALENWRSGVFNPEKVKFYPVEKLRYPSRPIF